MKSALRREANRAKPRGSWLLALVCATCAAPLAACGLDVTGALSGGPFDAGSPQVDAASPSGSGGQTDGPDAASGPPIGGGQSGDAGAASDALPPPSTNPGPCDGGPAIGDGGAIELVSPMSASPPFGGNGGQTFDDECPSGMALVGFFVVLSPTNAITHVQGICAPLAFGPCAITVGPPVAMVDHGATPGAPSGLLCPADSVVAGITVSTTVFVDSISFTCAPIVGRAPGGGFKLGALTRVGPLGTTQGGTQHAPFTCPSPMVANDLGGAAGGFVNSIRIGCATPFMP